MPQVANPRKVFNWALEVEGLNQFEAQTVTMPEVEVEKTTHGDTNHDIKTPGRYMVDDIVIEKLKPAPGSSLWAWDWLLAAQNPLTGGGSLPGDIKKTIVFRELDPSGTIALNSWICEGCWVTKISPGDYDRNSSDNIIETVTISVDRVTPI